MTTELIPYQEQSITTHEAQVKVLPLAELFANFIQATGQRSKNTARAYGKAAGLFLQWLGELQGVELARPLKDGRKTVWEIRGDTIPLQGVDLATLDKFSLWLAQEGSEQSTINNRLAAVNSFMSVALRDEVITWDQGQRLGVKPYKAKQRRNQKPTGRRLTVKEVKKLRAIVDLRAKTDTKALRDRAIIDLMLFAGLRRDEVANLAISDIKPDGGRWWVIPTGKGNKTRRLKIHDVLYTSLADWLQATGRELGNGDSGPIFYNMNKGGNLTGKVLNASVIGRLVAEYGNAAGLAPREAPRDPETGRPVRGVVLGPHDLRRTCARNARENGAALEKVQAMLGHSDIKTTMLYIGEFEDDTDTAVDYVRYTEQ